jgi:GT2 family glycosyltransferase
MSSKSVFAVIINWNGERDTIACLESLLTVQYDQLHVVISDNGSKPSSLEAIRLWLRENLSEKHSPCGIKSCTLLDNGTNLGFTGGNTAGIRYALDHNADYVLFLNNDTIATREFLGLMVEAADSDERIGIAGCKIFYAAEEPDGRHKIWSLGGYSFRLGMAMNIASNRFDERQWVGIRSQELINGCCMLIKRAVIETIGVQDDRLFFGIDDVEYSLRASRHGWHNIVIQDAVIYHAASQSVVPRSGLQVYYLFRNLLFFRLGNFAWYENIGFLCYFLLRYVVAGCVYRSIRGRRHVNLGVYLGIADFLKGNMGECRHAELFVKHRLQGEHG